ALFILAGMAASAAPALAWKPEQPGDYFPNSDYVYMINRKVVSCKKILGPRTMVMFTFGQSNSANSSPDKYTPKQPVYVFYEGKCYEGMDPLPGTSGSGGSLWPRLADKLIEAGMYDKVLIVAVGVGGTPMKRWTPGPEGDLYGRVLDAFDSLKKKDIKITHLLWHQGENDNGSKTPKDQYKKMFMTMVGDIRKQGVDAPIYVAVATRCGRLGEGFEIQQAQRELVNTELKIFPGAFSDEITSIDDRHDACHFTGQGLDKHATLWFNAIKYSGM
ncbi:MAG TPA: sialate O-acetylesterase, partial [bacterium]|nr:sialate O-acetylesterase [bacterium]